MSLAAAALLLSVAAAGAAHLILRPGAPDISCNPHLRDASLGLALCPNPAWHRTEASPDDAFFAYAGPQVVGGGVTASVPAYVSLACQPTELDLAGAARAVRSHLEERFPDLRIDSERAATVAGQVAREVHYRASTPDGPGQGEASVWLDGGRACVWTYEADAPAFATWAGDARGMRGSIRT